jgi:TP901 family phage tail tape measure protein
MSGVSADLMAKQYNTLAKQLGATTLEVAKGSLEWQRQGKSVQETQTLLTASTMMGKLANIESAQSTEYLTSILNGFQLQAGDAVGVIDKLVSVDNAAATSVAELASALQRSSNIAQQSGVSFEELVAYIGTVSSVTRRSA